MVEKPTQNPSNTGQERHGPVSGNPFDRRTGQHHMLFFDELHTEATVSTLLPASALEEAGARPEVRMGFPGAACPLGSSLGSSLDNLDLTGIEIIVGIITPGVNAQTTPCTSQRVSIHGATSWPFNASGATLALKAGVFPASL